MNQEIACSVLIRDIYLTWARDAGTFLRRLSEQGMELDLTQTNAVTALLEADGGELALKELERALHMSQSAVARMAVRLEEAGYVESRMGGADRRVKRVRLTEKGRLCGACMVELLTEAEEQLLHGMTPGERLLLRELLDRALENSIQANSPGAEKIQIQNKERNDGQS